MLNYRKLDVLIRQWKSPTTKVPEYIYSSKFCKNPSLNRSSSDFKQFIHHLSNHLFPKGYPNSVREGYFQYILYNIASSVTSSAGGVIATQSLLYGLGLGNASIPLAATLNWVLKDGLGQLGGILFASVINQQFDKKPKKWRFIAAVTLEISNIMEIMTMIFPQYFLPLAAVANVGKNICALSTSASRAAIHKSFALEENLADITAKTGSQNILSSLVGTSLGIFLSTISYQDSQVIFTCFSILSTSSLIFSYQALQYVQINTLTTQRFDHILEIYFSSDLNIESNQMKNIPSSTCLQLPTIQQINQKEKYLELPKIPHLRPLSINALIDKNIEDIDWEVSK
jgi:hypothetical protein